MTSYEQYREQMSRYTRDTSFLSFIKPDHPAFQAMLLMGEDIASHLLYDLLMYDKAEEHDFDFDPWAAFWLLGRIANKNEPVIVVSDDAKGRLSKLRDIYLDWGRSQGRIFLPKTS